MKPTAFLVNTSRGPIVSESALAGALTGDGIAGAALDAFDHEPIASNHPYRALDNLVLSPHLGYVYAEFFTETVRAVKAYFSGHSISLLTGQRSPTSAEPAARCYEDVS